MSAEVIVKKRGRPKKVVDTVPGEVLEAPKKSTVKRTTTKAKPAVKKVAVMTEKPVKVEAAKSRLPAKKPNSSVLEEIQKLEALKERTNPTVLTKSTAPAEAHSSPIKPITTPIKTSSKPTPSLPNHIAISPPVANAFNSKILKEVEALSKKASPTNETSGSTTGEIPSESKTKPITAKVETISKDPVSANKVSGSITKTVEKPAVESTTKPITTGSAHSPRNLQVPADSTIPNAFSFKPPKEIEAFAKKPIPVDGIKGMKAQTSERPTQENISKSISASTKVVDTRVPLKDARIETVSNPPAAKSMMAKSGAKPNRQNLPPSLPASQNAQPKPKIPITHLNSRIVSDLSARGGARLMPGKLPAEYKPLARSYTRFIVALPILFVTSYVLYERLAVKEDQRLISFPSLGPKKDEAAPISKDGPTN